MSSPSYAAAGQQDEPHESVPLGAAALSRLEYNVELLEASIAALIVKIGPLLEIAVGEEARDCVGCKRSSAELFTRIENSSERLYNLTNHVRYLARRIEL